MRCRDAKIWLAAQHTGNLAPADAAQLEEHLNQCPACRAFELRQQCLNSLLLSPAPRSYSSISTDRIMLAVQRRKQVTRQLEDIRTQQQTRIARIRGVGATIAALAFFTLASLPLLLLALTIVRPDLLVNLLSLLGGFVGVLVILAQFLQVGLSLITHDSRLLLGAAFVLVALTGMWLRLMRHPQEV
jgi:anti-sigma factor RsiW